jgi:hypothetical protein
MQGKIKKEDKLLRFQKDIITFAKEKYLDSEE